MNPDEDYFAGRSVTPDNGSERNSVRSNGSDRNSILSDDRRISIGTESVASYSPSAQFTPTIEDDTNGVVVQTFP